MSRKSVIKVFRFGLFKLCKMKFRKHYFFLNPFILMTVFVLAFYMLLLSLNHDAGKTISDDMIITNDTLKHVRGGCLPFNKACLIMQ